MDEPVLSAEVFRDQLHEALRFRSLKLLGDYLDRLDREGVTTAELHRFTEWAVRTLGAEAEKKGAGLPTVNISIGVGGQITAQVQIEDVQQEINLIPTPGMLAAAAINADLVLDAE